MADSSLRPLAQRTPEHSHATACGLALWRPSARWHSLRWHRPIRANGKSGFGFAHRYKPRFLVIHWTQLPLCSGRREIVPHPRLRKAGSEDVPTGIAGFVAKSLSCPGDGSPGASRRAASHGRQNFIRASLRESCALRATSVWCRALEKGGNLRCWAISIQCSFARHDEAHQRYGAGRQSRSNHTVQRLLVVVDVIGRFVSRGPAFEFSDCCHSALGSQASTVVSE